MAWGYKQTTQLENLGRLPTFLRENYPSQIQNLLYSRPKVVFPGLPPLKAKIPFLEFSPDAFKAFYFMLIQPFLQGKYLVLTH